MSHVRIQVVTENGLDIDISQDVITSAVGDNGPRLRQVLAEVVRRVEHALDAAEAAR